MGTESLGEKALNEGIFQSFSDESLTLCLGNSGVLLFTQGLEEAILPQCICHTDSGCGERIFCAAVHTHSRCTAHAHIDMLWRSTSSVFFNWLPFYLKLCVF